MKTVTFKIPDEIYKILKSILKKEYNGNIIDDPLFDSVDHVAYYLLVTGLCSCRDEYIENKIVSKYMYDKAKYVILDSTFGAWYEGEVV